MTITQYIESSTIAAPGRGVSIAELRRAYQRDQGAISRTAFVIALAAGGHALLSVGEHTHLVGRILTEAAA